VIRARENKTELTGVMDGVSGEVVWKTVKTRSGREGEIRASRAEKAKGDFGVGKKAVSEVIGEVGVSRREQRDEVAFLASLLPSLQGWFCEFVGAQIAQATAARENTLCTLTRSHCPNEDR
jgi:hypothetical protein